ncbi:MAG: ATP synthase F0 subunit B [Planctomycetaceae bacterium]|nr:ATP synthase F0 subunit B [Planctomycetaceae bacterium]
MSPWLTTFLFEVANFLVLASALTWLLFRPVRNAIEQRRESIADEQKQAADKLTEADRIKNEIKQRFTELDQEIQQKRETARQEATKEAEQIVADARSAADRERAALQRQITYLEHSRIERLSQIIAATTGQTVGRLLEDLGNSDLRVLLVQEGCQRLQALSEDLTVPVVVESAWDLSDAEKSSLQEAIGPSGQPIEFHTVQQLKAGLRISTNRGLIDLSEAGLANFAERALTAQLNHETQQHGDQVKHAGSA